MKNRSKQRGQATIESILIITMLFFALSFTVGYIRNQGLLARLVEGPWGYLAGMIENGIWVPPEQGVALHPNHISRHGSPQGDLP